MADSTDFVLDGHLTLLDAPMFNVVLANVTGAEITGLNITSTWYKDPKSGSLKAGLPDGYSQIFRWYVFGPSGFWTMAPLRYAAKFDLSL